MKDLKNLANKPTWLFLGLFMASSVICVSALRHNNQQMVRLRDGVYAADKSGSGIEQALQNLRSYVYAHMNTDLSSGSNIKPPIQLKYTYQRLQKAEEDRVNTANSQVYTDAQNYCQALNTIGFSGRTRVPCVTDYVTSHGVQANPIPVALYEFDFVSPAWSPDLAGWTLLISVISLILFLGFLAVDKIVSRQLKDV